MIMQKVAPAADGSHELIGGSVLNRNATPASISKIGRVSLARFARFVVAYNITVIVWGAYVRATGSGAGCGSHWPLCNGEFLPTTPQTQTVIEFAHRVTSGLSLVLVAILLIWCWRRTAKGDRPRHSAVAAAVLLFNEAFLGALLVLVDHVGGLDRSATHALFLCLHFGNTLLLLAALALTAKWLSNRDGRLGVVPKPWNDRLAGHSWGHHVSCRLTAARGRARLLIEQSHSVALEGSPPCRRSDRFYLCFVAAPGLLAKTRALRMGAPPYHHTDWPDCARRNERDSVGTCLAANDASTGCRNSLDPARTCVRRSVVCQPPFGRSAFPNSEHGR